MSQLESLDLSNNQLSDVPGKIKKLENLRILNLQDNLLKSLPKDLEKMQKLQEIKLEGNRLSDESKKEIKKMLPEINISFDRVFTSLAKALQVAPEKVDILFLNHHKLRHLPKELQSFTNLKELMLRGNDLRAIPPFLAKLKELKKLDLKLV